MKKRTKFAFAVVMTCALFACGEKKTTEKDAQNAESLLFSDDMTLNTDTVPYVVDVFCKYVEQNPEAPTAPEWLFKALEIAPKALPAEKSLEIGNKLIADYPSYDKIPAAMFLLGLMVYEDQLHDLDKAREMYESLITNYPDNEFAASAQFAIKNLGKTPEELIREFETMADTIDTIPQP